MKIGVVVHGPNIIDSGYALKLIKLLENYGEVSAKLGGTMGRTAVIDLSLENIIDISQKLVPSDSLKIFYERNVDIIFLLNYGKSDVTGQVFGYKVYNHFIDKIDKKDVSVIQIERPGEETGSIINWGKSNDLTIELANKLNLNIIAPNDIFTKYFKQDNIDNISQRRVYGVSPNENIMVNSVVIGKSTSNELKLIAENGYIVDIEGGILKEHGLEKLGKIDLNSAIIKTGLLRKANINPRILKKESSNKIAFLDHAGEDVYRFSDVDCVVTVGDDTTLISSDILYRFNIPVIGITDGDLDKVVENGFKAKNSIIFEVESGFDDIVGKKIHEKIFKNKSVLSNVTIKEIESNIVEIINNMNCKYKISYI